jgi:3-oxoacyl-(acyl-carrier-protein) synthase
MPLPLPLRMPLNVPNGVRQQECIQEAYRRSGVSPDDTDYVELHGTGGLFTYSTSQICVLNDN